MVADGSMVLGVKSPKSSPARMLSAAHRMSCNLSRDFPLACIYLDTPEISLCSIGNHDALTSAVLLSQPKASLFQSGLCPQTNSSSVF